MKLFVKTACFVVAAAFAISACEAEQKINDNDSVSGKAIRPR